MTNEKLISLMNDARLIAAADNVIFPLIELKIKDKLATACARFRAGETNFVADLAYITALEDIKSELSQKQTRGQQALEKLHKQEKE